METQGPGEMLKRDLPSNNSALDFLGCSLGRTRAGRGYHTGSTARAHTSSLEPLHVSYLLL